MSTPTAEQLSTEQTKAQAVFGVGLLWAAGGCVTNPCGFWGYADGYPQSYQTYHWMLRHPIVQLVREIRTAPIIASYWQYRKADDSVPDARVELVKRNLDPIRAQSIEEIIDGMDYGWQPFENIWDSAGGETRLVELKALSQWMTSPLVNDKGRLVGVSQGAVDTSVEKDGQRTDGLPIGYKSWVYTYKKKRGNVFGRSWLENFRETAWKGWLDCAQQIQKIGAKIAGTQALVRSPKANKDACIQLVKDLSNGAPGAWLPNLVDKIDVNGQADMWKLLIELSKTSLMDIQVLEFGDTAPAIANILDQMRHYEELMFAGGLRSTRTALEGKHGTKAEAGVHTDTGMLSAEADDDSIAIQAQVIVDAILELNFGPSARGSVLIDAPPLVDSKAQQFAALIDKLSSNTAISAALAKHVDMDEMLNGLDIPIREGSKFEIEEPKPQPSAAPTGNGNDPRINKAMKRLGKMVSK